jgi:hypothetical protein
VDSWSGHFALTVPIRAAGLLKPLSHTPKANYLHLIERYKRRDFGFLAVANIDCAAGLLKPPFVVYLHGSIGLKGKKYRTM